MTENEYRHRRVVSKTTLRGWFPTECHNCTNVELSLFEVFVYDNYVTAEERWQTLVTRLQVEGRLKL
jgi:hypothetical protein